MADLKYKISAESDIASKSIKNLSSSLSTLGRSSKSTSDSFSKLFSNIRKNNNSFSNITKDANRTNQSLSSLKSTMSGLNSVIGVGQLYLLSRGLQQAITASLDMIEVTNLFNVAMGDSTESANAYLESMNEVLGLDMTNLRSATGTFGLLARSMGIASEDSETISLNMVKLATDLSSLTNVPINQVMQDLRSGLLGQSETVYKYGLDVTEASLKSEALAQGITKSVRNMSQGEKLSLRYAVALKQSTLAQGDFARTINSPANQLKILSERFVTLTRAIGTLFIPILEATLPYLNALVSMLTRAVQSLALLIGYEMPTFDTSSVNNFASGIEDAEDGVDSLSKKMKGLAGIDELNLLGNSSASGGASTSGGTAEFDYNGYDNLMGTVKAKSEELRVSLEGTFSSFLSNFDTANIDFDKLTEPLGRLYEAVSKFGATVGEGLIALWNNVIVPMAEWTVNDALPVFFDLLASSINLLISAINLLKPAFKILWDKILSPLASWTGGVIVSVVGKISDSFTAVGNWIDSNHGTIKGFIDTLGKLFGAWALFETLAFVGQAGGIVNAMKAISIATSDVTLSLGKQLAQWILLTASKSKDLAQTVVLKAMYIGDFLKSIGSVTLGLISQIKQWLAMSIAKVADAVKTGAITVATNLMAVAQGALNLVMSLNPIGLIVLALTGLGVALVSAYKNVAWFRDGLNNIWLGIQSGFIAMVNGMIKGLNFLIKGLGKIKITIPDWVPEIGGRTFGGNFIAPIQYLSLPSLQSNATNTGITPTMLARGGMVDSGAVFQAGEFGKAEMIGNYNGKTTVMPLENTDFVKAIRDAVFEGAKEAMASSESQINVSISEEAIGNSAIKIINRNNRRFSKGVITT